MCKSSSNYSAWFSSSLKYLIFSKKIAHKIYKQLPNRCNYNTFSNLRAQCKIKNKLEYVNYIQKAQNSVSNNPKYFWKFVNKNRSNTSSPSVMFYDNTNFSGGDVISNCFSQYFSSVFNPPITPI